MAIPEDEVRIGLDHLELMRAGAGLGHCAGLQGAEEGVVRLMCLDGCANVRLRRRPGAGVGELGAC